MKINHTFTISLIVDATVSAGTLLDWIKSRLCMEKGTYLVVESNDKVVIRKVSSISAARETRPDLVEIRDRWNKVRYRNLFVRESHGELVIRVAEEDPEDRWADLTNVVLRSECATKDEMEAWARAVEDIAILLKVIDEKDDAAPA